MKNIKTKEEVLLERKNSIYDLVNQFISKAKKDYNIDAKENFSEIDLAQMLVDFVIKNYLNADSLPVKTILGIEGEDEDVVTDEVTDEIIDDSGEEFTDAVNQDIEDIGPEVGEGDDEEITAEF